MDSEDNLEGYPEDDLKDPDEERQFLFPQFYLLVTKIMIHLGSYIETV